MGSTPKLALAQFVTDIEIPEQIKMDRDSLRSMRGAVFGNSFCGIMSVPDGVIYTVPYTYDISRPPWTPSTAGDNAEYLYQAKCAGMEINRIYHQEGGISGHTQLSKFLAGIGIVPKRGFVGFSVLYASQKEGFGRTSRSWNNTHFREWKGMANTQDEAFANYHKKQKHQGLPGPPKFKSVTTNSAAGGGGMPDEWATKIKECIVKNLGRDYVSSTKVTVYTPPVKPNEGPVPPATPPAIPKDMFTRRQTGTSTGSSSK